MNSLVTIVTDQLLLWSPYLLFSCSSNSAMSRCSHWNFSYERMYLSIYVVMYKGLD